MKSSTRWNAMKMEELRLYRESHSLVECGERFGISAPRARTILERYARLLYSRTMRYDESRKACGFQR